MRRLLFAVAPLVALSACAKGETLGCDRDTQCPAGNVCLARKCEQICESDADCAKGYVCGTNLCEAGRRTLAPKIDSVFGNGSANCPDAVAGHCFADGLIIQGAALSGASFALQGTSGGASFTLAPTADRADDRMGVSLPQDLYEGSFTLVAMNAVGSDQVSVQILRGEAGPTGPDMTGDELVAAINTGATSPFVVSVMPSANDLINHLNGGSVKIDPAILPPASGGTSYTGDDIVNLINNGATTAIDADELATADTLMARINGAVSTLLAAARLPVANDIISRLNGGDGSVKISSNVLPAASGGMTGNQIVTALNDASTTQQINVDNLVTGTTGTSVALGNHTHDGSAIVSGTVAYARLPVGTTAGTVAAGDHTHPGSGQPFHKQALPGSWTSGVTISGTELATVKALCGDPGGCELQIGVRYSRVYYNPTWYDLPAIMYGPPCRFHIDSANHWTLSPWCLQPLGTFNAYSSAQFDTLGGGYGAYYILQYAVGGANACTLAESGPSGTDDGNLHFWMENIDNTSFQSSQASRTCELHITQ